MMTRPACCTVATVFTYNNANEQTNMNDGTSSLDMAYDTWGRLTSKDDGTYTATYAYRYGGKLYSVTSDFPGEGNVTYETGGDGKRRSRVAGLAESWYNYTAGFDVVSTEDDADGSTGALTMTNVVRSPRAQVSATLADLAGATPSTGTARYYATDHLGSTRSVWNASKVAVGTYEFTPYGVEYNHTGAALDTLAGGYTGKPWDDTAKLFHFPYRQYSPDMARWTSRDPLGMADGPNVYAYVRGNLLNRFDRLGLYDCWGEYYDCLAECNESCGDQDSIWHQGLLAICKANCEVRLQLCLAIENLSSFCTNHPAICVVGAIIVVAGVAYVVVSTGGGALVLVPAAV
jgi:RHS repeat-associated protein